MLNEVQEFRAYTGAVPGPTGSLGRFTLESIRDFLGFERIFTILARGYLFRDDGDPYERVDSAKNALRAWCSVPDEKAPPDQWKFSTCFPALHEAFPELVDENGNGWYIRHIRGIAAYAQAHPQKVKSNVKRYLTDRIDDYETAWRNKVRQYQIPIFLESTDAIWQIRFDDVVANALTLGPLRDMEAAVTPEQKEKLLPFVKGKVRLEHLVTLVAYYKANKPEDSDWVVLPASGFNNYFGSTVFSKQVLKELTDTVILRSSTSYGSGRFRVKEEYL